MWGLSPKRPRTPVATHRELLAVGDLVREGPDALVSTKHLQAGEELGQLLVAPGVVPEGRGGIGNGHCPYGDMGTPTQPHLPVVVGGEDGPEHHVLLPDDLQQLKGTQSSGEWQRR